MGDGEGFVTCRRAAACAPADFHDPGLKPTYMLAEAQLAGWTCFGWAGHGGRSTVMGGPGESGGRRRWLVAGSRSRGPGLRQRVESAAEAALRESKSVSPVDVFGRIGWLPGSLVDLWRQGRVDSLEQVMNVGPEKLAGALEKLRAWAQAGGLVPSEIGYPTPTPDRRPLRVTPGGGGPPEAARRARRG